MSRCFPLSDNYTELSSFSHEQLFPIYIISGISYGTVELIRRVIPRDIVGGDVQLVSLLAAVHSKFDLMEPNISWVAPTNGCYCAYLVRSCWYRRRFHQRISYRQIWIQLLIFPLVGLVFLLASLSRLTPCSRPIFFTFAAIAWQFVDDVRANNGEQTLEDMELEHTQGRADRGYISSVLGGFAAFFKATWYGGFLVFSRES
jgi:hypothetical protein